MAKLILTPEEAVLCDAVGVRTFLQARAVLADEEVVVQAVGPTGQAVGQVRRGGVVTGELVPGATPTLTGVCTCSDADCVHVVALLLAAQQEPSPTKAVAPVQRRPATRRWESQLSAWMRDVAGPPPASEAVEPEIGLQFELVDAYLPRSRRTRQRISMRPVLPGRRGGWVRSGISWHSLGYAGGRSVEQHRQLLYEIVKLSGSHTPYYYGGSATSLFLDEFGSRRIWDLLAEAQESGLPLVQYGKDAVPVVVARRPARVSMQVGRVDGDLSLQTVVQDDGVPVDLEHAIFVGEPAHGMASWGARTNGILRLAPLDRPLPKPARKVLTAPSIRVPADQEERFFAEFFPGLARQLEVVPGGPGVHLPEVGAPTLTVTLSPVRDHQLRLRWEWTAEVGRGRHSEPLWLPTLTEEQADLVRRVTDAVVPGLLEPGPLGARLAAESVLGGDEMIHFLRTVVPALADLGVSVVEPDEDWLLQPSEAPPVITFSSAAQGSEQDWFDLSVRVDVGDERVDFEALFVALAREQEFLILPSGVYFSLDRPEFRQLRELIAESRALTDSPPGVLRVGRFQAGVWDELAEVGELAGQAADWQRTVATLSEAGVELDQAVPADVRADLRPYQLEGFRWLAALHDNGLGGILADDMGLGKTLQALALLCHARKHGRFLVVAPASVVHNWAAEAARFTPDLDVRAITSTAARRGAGLAEAVEEADVVVTSYTLFRLEYDDYAALEWAGLVLDEAQFVKNPQSQAYRCARRLPAPFKVAITGTPMENNLTELWALCSIAAPGLFPRLDLFTEYYRRPIEREQDKDRLAQLRRRIRPLVLRRRKGEVAADLPPKQEQVVEVDLSPGHRKVYQRYLQRERQKVLGLLGDLEQNRFEIFRSLTLLRQASLDVALVDEQHRAVSSTKLDLLVEQLTDIVAEGHRTLVFSQFTRFLGAARDRLERAGIACAYLDGATRNRKRVIEEFKTGAAPVFLISLKAGGFGLNLTEADYCILLDPWWNPATEAQAVDRTHRIGQTRNVMVYRLVARDTIEEKVMALQARKAELFAGVMDGGDFTSAGLTAADIRELLG
ncbi:DEAD/DEAH box helicase [Paractinoplanes brasiliensis]|uniref:SNF2 family DNA or RNA helicase n=1 Tax=Paractinoplanes brasiliensis TaxID=52695 RepID=A0A4V3C7T8_9ACTN|nr:DEAD/DEAH box helicase [Actinoplanes brasiliensis]TDO38968.1 SNF2 family DNA or RNA helicase [Actinoplanes brasiliensis]GID33205.1 DNA helicase [Actinoplanes brasiliensis]